MQMLALEHAPAKINLALHITGRRPDGYHELDSVVVFADVTDVLRASKAQNDTLTISGPFAHTVPAGQTNLVLEAVAAFRRHRPGAVPFGLAIDLEKNLPVAAGIGGGSADAAAALRLMTGLATPLMTAGEFDAIAAQLGADVPVCLSAGPARMQGLGERIGRLSTFPVAHLVLVNPLIPLSTHGVFAGLAHTRNPPLPDLPATLGSVSDLAQWLRGTRNDLQPPAIDAMPAIGGLVKKVATLPGCLLARMSGSGATVFGLFATGDEAAIAARRVRDESPRYWVVAVPVLGVQ